MNKLFFTLLASLTIAITSAQIKEGTVVYERKINMYRKITDEQMRAYVPEFKVSKHVLIFSDSTSMFKAVIETELPEQSNGTGQRMVFSMGSASEDDELYNDFKSLKSILKTELGAKTFIIDDSIKLQEWTLTGETKKIAGYTCKKAVSMQQVKTGGAMKVTFGGNENARIDSSKIANAPKIIEVEVVAWYAEALNSPSGPENYTGLPGVILQLDFNNGEIVYTAIELKKSIDKKELKEPTKGKKITQAEFKKLQKEMMNNMLNGGGGMIRIGN